MRAADPDECAVLNRRAARAYSIELHTRVRRDRAGARRLDLDLTLTWLRAMAITEEEKQLREALRASLRTAAIEARSRAASRRLWQDAVAESLAEAFRRSWEEESQEYADLEAATKESALEEVRRRQGQLVAIDDELFITSTRCRCGTRCSACQSCGPRFWPVLAGCERSTC